MLDTVELCDVIAQCRHGSPFVLQELLRLCLYADIQDEVQTAKIHERHIRLTRRAHATATRMQLAPSLISLFL